MLSRIFILAAAIAIASCLPKHPLVRDEAPDFENQQANEMLKHILRSGTGNDVQLEQGELGFSWDNCGKPT